MAKTIILASKSLGRKLLLEEAGFRVIVQPTKADESHQRFHVKESVQLLAKRKMAAFLLENPKPEYPVIASDTLLEFQGAELGQPAHREDALHQLTQLRGSTHSVYSAWELWINGTIYRGWDQSFVTFKTFDDDALQRYLETNEWAGAAGSYRYQGVGKALVESLEGDETTVIGLPMNQIFGILAKALP